MSNLRVALEFSAIDHATATARLISQSVGGVGKAAHQAGLATSPIAKLTHGLGQVGIQLNSMGSAQAGLDGVASTLKEIGSRIKDIAGAGLSRIGGGLSKIGSALPKPGGIGGLTATAGGVAAAVGGGFEVHEILQDNEFFNRLRINTGAPIEQIEALRHHFLDAARDARISSDEMKLAFDSLREGGAPLDFIDASLDTVAASIQRLNGHGGDIGELFANLRKFDDLQGPQQLLQAMATLQAQIKGVPGGLEDFVPATAPLLAQYKEMGHAGLEAVKEIGAVYATVAQGTATPRQARSATEGILSLLSDRQSAIQLQGLGVNVFGHNKEEVQQNFDAGKTLPLTEILQSLLKKYTEAPAVFDQVLGEGFKRDFRIPLAETKEQGFSPTLNQKLETTGDPAQFLRQAHEASEGLSGSLNSLNVSLKQVGESVLATPFAWLADGLNRFNGVATVGITVIGGLGILGTVGNLVTSVNGGLLKLGINLPSYATSLVAFGRAGFGVVPALSGMALNLGLAAESMAGFVSWSPALSGVFTAMSGGFVAVGAAIEATPIGWIITGIAAVAFAAYLIYEHWTPIRAWFGELWGGVGQVFSGAWDFVVGLVTGDSERAIGGIETVWVGIKGFFATLIRGLFDDTPIGLIVAPFLTPIVLITEHWTAFKAWVGDMLSAIGEIFQGEGEFIAGVFTGDMDRAVAGIEQIWQGFEDFFSNLWDGIVGTAEAAFEKIASVTNILPDWITGAHSDETPAKPAVTAPKLPPSAPPAIGEAAVKAPAPLPSAALPLASVSAVPSPAPASVAQNAPAAPVALARASVQSVPAPVPQAIAPSAAGFVPASAAVPSIAQASPNAAVSRSDETAQLLQYFEQQGWTKQQAAGIVSNLTIESGLRPDAVGDHGAAFGLAQWHSDRQADFRAAFGKDIRGASVLDQAKFVQFELTQGKEVAAGKRLREANSAYEAGAIVSDRYERPLDTSGNERIRGALAERLAALPQIGVPALPSPAPQAVSVPGVAPPKIGPQRPLLQAASLSPDLPTLGPTLGAPIPTAFGRDSVTEQAGAQRGNAGQIQVLVKFVDTPKGTQIETNSPPGGPRVSVDVGYAFAVT
jgi:hypothetical protein